MHMRRGPDLMYAQASRARFDVCTCAEASICGMRKISRTTHSSVNPPFIEFCYNDCTNCSENYFIHQLQRSIQRLFETSPTSTVSRALHHCTESIMKRT